MGYREWAERYIALAAYYRMCGQPELEVLATNRAAYHLRMARGGR